MNENLDDFRDRIGLALCAKRYTDIISMYKHYLQATNSILPIDRENLYLSYQKLIVDYNFKSYWKLISNELNTDIQLKYLNSIENQIETLCKEIIEIIDNYFLASKLNNDFDIVYTLRQRGDFLFFHSSISRPATRQIILQSALRSYTEGVERSRLTLPIDEPERVLIQIRKCSCEVQLSNGLCPMNVYSEFNEVIDEMKRTISSHDHRLIIQMENYRQELENILC